MKELEQFKKDLHTANEAFKTNNLAVEQLKICIEIVLAMFFSIYVATNIGLSSMCLYDKLVDLFIITILYAGFLYYRVEYLKLKIGKP